MVHAVAPAQSYEIFVSYATEDRETFVQLMLADIPAPPTDAAAIRSANLEAIRSTVAIRS